MNPASKRAPAERIQLLDGLRGLCILLMLAYHFAVDLVMFEMIPEHIVFNGFLNILVVIFAGTFIVLAGISSRFSRSNLKRGLVTLACAAAVSAVSLAVSEPVFFGILHLMASCMLAFHVLEKLRITLPVTLLAAFVPVYLSYNYEDFTLSAWPDVPSMDYFPIYPWGFLFILGTVIGKPIAEGKWPSRFYTAKVPFLSAAGRHTLVLYLAHQPLFWGIMMLLKKLGTSTP